MDAMTLLSTRHSVAKLSEPAPDRAALERMLAAALRAPDHGHIRPWRFLVIQGPARERLGELFVRALLQRKPDASEEEQNKARQAPLRAPLLVTVIARLRPHPKVPEVEQLLSAGCAAHSIVLAAHALGFGAIWRTGDTSYDITVKSGLGLVEGEEIVGYIYLGTPASPPKLPAALPLADYVSDWH